MMSENKKFGNSLLALSSAAVLAVYAAGYVRTRAAAERFAEQTEARVRPAFTVAAPPVSAASSPERPAAADSPAHDSDAMPAVTTKHEPVRKLRRKKTVELIAPGPDRTTLSLAVPAAPAAHDEPAEPKEAKESESAVPPQSKAPAEPKAPQWKDGTYFGWGTSRHGDIQAQVVIEGGRIASATIAQCLTRYSCSVIAKLPPEVAERQSPEVDYVSGATQSTNAFYYAVVEALSKAK
jgi:uncharacterized protein with FMN-binding domain